MIKIIVSLALMLVSLNAQQTITVAGPSAGVTHPVFHMIKND